MASTCGSEKLLTVSYSVPVTSVYTSIKSANSAFNVTVLEMMV